MSSDKRAPKKPKVAAGSESRRKARSPRKKQSSQPSHSQELARKVYESLPEASVVEMLLSSKPFLELCDLEAKKVGPVLNAFQGYLKSRSEWLRKDSVYAATVFVQCWPEYRPPSWVMDWIRQGLSDFLEEKGSLALSLGFTERAPRSAERRQRLLLQFVEISRLRALGLNVRDAASLVCCRDNPTLHAVDDLKSADKLDAMTNSLTAEYMRYPGRDDLTRAYKLMPVEKIAASWLSKFPKNEVLRTPLRKFLL